MNSSVRVRKKEEFIEGEMEMQVKRRDRGTKRERERQRARERQRGIPGNQMKPIVARAQQDLWFPLRELDLLYFM